MIGKIKAKQIRSLSQKKFRNKSRTFLVEGTKVVLEVLNSHVRVKELFATVEFLTENQGNLIRAERITEISEEEIKGISLLKHPQQCLALCSLPHTEPLPRKLTGLSLYLDSIQDPGNLGTIIRISDWFGLEYLFCSPDTADMYNPKVIQASMGSFCRVKTVYSSFDNLMQVCHHSNIPVFGTCLEGHNIFTGKLPPAAVVVLGNEGSGVRSEILQQTTQNLMIPSFNPGKNRAESLNVAVSTGIICCEFRRQHSLLSTRNENLM
ncbi:MAG: RNA methyltransferase [Mariniphaga sp.]|nr:RNA methyltransferase [Mariniphaga sp.]MDD4425071.1 RNA methyltransferase [Mariniphaga sp.]